MRKILCFCLLAWMVTCNAQGQPEPLDAASRAALIAKMAQILRSNYVMPDMAETIATQLLRRTTEGVYDGIDQPSELALRLTEDLRRIGNDRHLGVLYQPPAPPGSSVSPGPPLDFARVYNHGFERVERLDGNIGYLDLRGFMQSRGIAETCAAALGFVAGSDALIIDLRNNTGGAPQAVELLASYFFAQRTHLNDIYDRPANSTYEMWTQEQVLGTRYAAGKDVYILVSRGTFSAAEDFAYAMQTLGRAKIIGEVTGGGAHPVTVRPMGHGLLLMVPDSKSISPITQTNWEGVGIQPDIPVPAFEALHVAYGLLLQRVAAQNTNEQRAALLTQQAQANAAALRGLRVTHAKERALPLATVRGEPEQLRASVAGRVAAEFLAVLNSGDLAAMQRFRERHSTNILQTADDYALYMESGGQELHSIVATQMDDITVLARGRRDGQWRTLRFKVDSVAPHPMLRLEVHASGAPDS